MKNTKIMTLLVVFLAVALFIGAASAADTRNVTNGENAFVFETINVKDATVLTKFSEGCNPTALNVIYPDPTNMEFSLLEAVVNGQYGTYYDASTWHNSLDNMDFVTHISIWYPELTIKAELTTDTTTGATSGDSIDGKTINRNTNVTFLVDAPKVGSSNTIGFEPKAKIVFTTPVGGKTTDFGTAKFDNITVNKPRVIAGHTALVNATAGTWTAQAEYTSTPFKDYAKKSNTISFTVQSTSLTLTATKDSVIRSNPFTATIQGNSKALYFVYLDGASADDINPKLQSGQPGMKSTVTDTNTPVNKVLVKYETSENIKGTYAYFETDASGQRVVQYNTKNKTEDKTYTVKVYAIEQKWTDANENYDVTPDYASVKVKVEKGAVTITASGDGSYYIGAEIKLTGTNTDSDEVYLFITGPNLDREGLVLKDLPNRNKARDITHSIAVKTDNTWEYKWDTTGIALDSGAYTIYATNTLTNGKANFTLFSWDGTKTAVKLSDSEYATISVNLKQLNVFTTNGDFGNG